MKMLICTPPKGGLGLGMGPLWDPSIRIPVRRTPARRRPAPPWPPTEPQIKKNETGQCGSPHNQGTGAGSSGPGRAFLECNSGAAGALGGGGGCGGGGGPAPSTRSSDLAWNIEDAARRALSN
jgi:hypothetical protein